MALLRAVEPDRCSVGSSATAAWVGVLRCPGAVRAVLAHRQLDLGILLAPFALPLRSTVQSSIAFTSIVGGNVAAAVVAAAVINLPGVVFTPVLTGFVLARHGV